MPSCCCCCCCCCWIRMEWRGRRDLVLFLRMNEGEGGSRMKRRRCCCFLLRERKGIGGWWCFRCTRCRVEKQRRGTQRGRRKKVEWDRCLLVLKDPRRWRRSWRRRVLRRGELRCWRGGSLGEGRRLEREAWILRSDG